MLPSHLASTTTPDLKPKLRQPMLEQPHPVTRVLVTANRLQLAALLEKGLRLQGWMTCAAITSRAVLEIMRREPIDIVLIDADLFQEETSSLVRAIDQERSLVVVLAEDYEMGNSDLRHIVTVEKIFIKPFSTHHLLSVLKQMQMQRAF